MTPELDEVREWLQKARNDLLSAQILLDHEPPVLDTAAFHAQQAVEKTIKAFLVWKAVQFERVHSLTYLMDLCEVRESGFRSLRRKVEMLAPFAVGIRYPGEVMDVSREEARDALATANAVWEFVLGLLPKGFHFSVKGQNSK